MTATVSYQGGLRTECIHLRSGETIVTDAPIDNQGKGAAFSPTDLCATALASCMLTTMGIKANAVGLNIDGSRASVVKEMASNPRRISTVRIVLQLPEMDKEMQNLMEHTAQTCPVALSLHPDLVQEVSFKYKNPG